MVERLEDLIRIAREARKTESGKPWSQERLAEAAAISKQWVSSIETGKKVPSLSLLINIYEQLVRQHDSETEESLAVWLLSWLDRLVQDEVSDESSKQAAKQTIDKAVSLLSQPVGGEAHSPCRLLEYFPFSSAPLTIVCGDRRELNPKTRGDVFAYSVSITDLTFLLKLGLGSDVTIKSDKLFVLMGKEYLEHEFGKTNLLVIGSPAVNFAARVINNYSVFRFNLPSWLKEKEEIIRTLKEPDHWDPDLPSLKELNELKNLNPFWQLAQNREDAELAASEKASSEETQEARRKLVKRLLNKTNLSDADVEHVSQLARMLNRILDGSTAKSMMNNFRMPGLIDFPDSAVQVTSTRIDKDFALISLAPNPFASSPDYVCIFVAGIHGPGTTHALRALAEDDFRDHPFGGIIEVEIDLFNTNWPARFHDASWRWQTKPYTADKLLMNLKNALDLNEGRTRKFGNLTDQEIQNCIKFVQHIARVCD
jgi:transcriptional regulator with XRE-family HTH domain